MTQSTVNVEESIFIDLPRAQLWEITALQFDKIGIWSSGVTDSEGHGVGENGAVCQERQCTPSYKGFKKTTERIIDYQPDQFHFTYKIAAGLPKMVVHATNQWLHLPEGKGTRMTMKINMELKGLMGWIMKGPLSNQMKKILKENLEELKVYAETGQVHERKKKLNQKLVKSI
ncbi:MAG: SRPBCC family protein [Bacteroidota bacterium]